MYHGEIKGVERTVKISKMVEIGYSALNQAGPSTSRMCGRCNDSNEMRRATFGPHSQAADRP
jgi:hypothetical protein